jgi:hypothetical protein
MWAGKIAIIMYIWSISMMFMLYYTNTIFKNATIASQGFYTYDALHTLAGTFAIHQQVNASLIFGDFIAALTVLFAIVTGQTISDAFSAFPFIDTSIQLLIQISFSLTSVFLWIYVVANRSL